MKRSELQARASSRDETVNRQSERLDAAVPLVQVERQNAAPGEGPFADLGFTPDAWRAYMQFNLCRAFPNVIGPAASGNTMGFAPRVLERSHASLVHQQINLDHRLKAYDGMGSKVPRDRIVGCCVATNFPKAPATGGFNQEWNGIPGTVDEAPEITAMAVLFKIAEGVNHFLGDQLSSKRPRSVSVEFNCGLENMGIYVPSTREIFSLMEAPEELLGAITENKDFGGLSLGDAPNGERLAWAYGGTDGEVEFRGTGIVQHPADRTARIQSVVAHSKAGDLCSLPAEHLGELLVGKRAKLVKAVSGAVTEILSIHTEGRHGPPGGEWRLEASETDPVAELKTLTGKRTWWRLTDIEVLDAAA